MKLLMIGTVPLLKAKAEFSYIYCVASNNPLWSDLMWKKKNHFIIAGLKYFFNQSG